MAKQNFCKSQPAQTHSFIWIVQKVTKCLMFKPANREKLYSIFKKGSENIIKPQSYWTLNNIN